MEEIKGWKEIIIEAEDGELIVDITAENYIAKDGYSIRLVPCEDEKPTIDVAEVVRCKDCISKPNNTCEVDLISREDAIEVLCKSCRQWS